MTTTRIAVSAGDARARVDLAVGALAPRLVSRDATRARVALTAAGMLLLSGDHVHVDVEVGPGCLLELEDVGGTVAYQADGRRSTWTLDAVVGAGGVLLWHGLPFVVTDDADVERRSSIRLEHDASAAIRETLVLGRHGERGGRLESSFTATDSDGPMLAEHFAVDGTVPEPGIFGAHRVLDSVMVLGFTPPTTAGDLVLEAPGAISRHLADETHTSRLDQVWEAWSALARRAHVTAS